MTETKRITVKRGEGARLSDALDEDHVVVEEPLEIRIRASRIAVVMRTPGHDEDLVRGFLFTERVVARREDIARIESCARVDASVEMASDENVVEAVLAPEVDLDLEALRRNVFASSSCGVCGKAALENVMRVAPRVDARGARFSLTEVRELVERLAREQHAFSRTGGLHAAGLFDELGGLLVVREDVGRHNAVDKAIGRALDDGSLGTARALVVTGRVSFEIVQKAAHAQVPLIVAVSAPSSLAIETAAATGIALVGFVRGARCNVYVETPILDVAIT